MRLKLIKLQTKIARVLFEFGFDLRSIFNWKYYFLYKKNRRDWLSSGGTISQNHMILRDFGDSAGIAKGHYFHQDLLVARFICEDSPDLHIDVGSRIDGFVAHVASFREIEVLDIRPMSSSVHSNIRFRQADLMSFSGSNLCDSLSCLHAIEHFGLGRYTDKIDVNGHIIGIDNLINLVKRGGRFYISFPIGLGNEVHFNAHRIFHPEYILSLQIVLQELKLLRFDYIDDLGDLVLDVAVESAVGKVKYGCGIYTFERL